MLRYVGKIINYIFMMAVKRNFKWVIGYGADLSLLYIYSMHWKCMGKLVLGPACTSVAQAFGSSIETTGVASASQWCKFEVDIIL